MVVFHSYVGLPEGNMKSTRHIGFVGLSILSIYTNDRLMWVKQFHKPSPSHQQFMHKLVVCLPFQYMGGL